MITDIMANEALMSIEVSSRATIPEQEVRKRMEQLISQIVSDKREAKTKRYYVAELESVPWQIWESAVLGGGFVTMWNKYQTERVAQGFPMRGRSLIGKGELASQFLNNLAAANHCRRYKSDARSTWTTFDIEIGTPPLWYTKGDWMPRKLIQVDLNAAYATIMTRLPGPCVVYDPPEQAFGYRLDQTWLDPDLLRSVKSLGTAVVGMFTMDQVDRYHFGNLVHEPFCRWRNPSVMRYVMDVLHNVARDARDHFGCLRWCVDSGIFQLEQGRAFMRYLDELWDLPCHVERQGKGQVLGLHEYVIGKYESGPYSTAKSRLRRNGTYGLDFATPTDNMVEDSLDPEDPEGQNVRDDTDGPWLRQIMFHSEDLELEEIQ